jgi:acyl transferase domain-containing protein
VFKIDIIMEVKGMNEQEFATELVEQVQNSASVSDVMHLLDQWRNKQEDILNNERQRVWVELSKLENTTALSCIIEIESDDLHGLIFHNKEVEAKVKLELKSQAEQFKQAVRPLMKYLGAEHHPHTSAIVVSNRAELVEGLEAFNTDEYVKD